MDFYLGIAVIIATLLGPVLAVFVTRIIDERRQKTSRQTEVFRSLMRSRRSQLSQDYVSALNTVEIEFSGVPAVENAQRELFQHLNIPSQQQDWFDRFRRLQTRLLYAIATHLGYKMEQLDVLEGGYVPNAWGTVEEEQQHLRKAMLELLSGKIAIKIDTTAPSASPGPTPVSTIRPISNTGP